MKTREKAIGAVSLALLVGLATPSHAAKYKIRWLLGHQNLDYFEEAADNFKKTVEAGSHGDIQVEVVTARDNSLETKTAGKGLPEIAVKVENGEAEMGHSFVDVMGAVDNRLYAFEAPYLFRDYSHMEGVFEGPVGNQMLSDLRSHHIVGLSFTYSGGASGVAANREIRRPEDLKGLKIGVFGDPVDEAWLRGLGATPVPLAHELTMISSMARDGSIDGVVITWRNFEREALNKEFKYVNLMNSTYLVSVTYVNEKFFAGLPKEYQKLLEDATRSTGRIERAKTIELNAAAKRSMLTKGVREVFLTGQDRKDFAQALKPAYEQTIDKVLGKGLIERIKKTGDGSGQPAVPGDIASNSLP